MSSPSGIPVTCENIRSFKCISSTSFSPISEHNQGNSLRDNIKNLPAEKKWSIDDWHLRGSNTDIVDAIKNHKAIAISDGSVKNSIGTSCFTLTTEQEVFHVVGLNRIPFHTKDSHRAELGESLASWSGLNSLSHSTKSMKDPSRSV